MFLRVTENRYSSKPRLKRSVRGSAYLPLTAFRKWNIEVRLNSCIQSQKKATNPLYLEVAATGLPATGSIIKVSTFIF